MGKALSKFNEMKRNVKNTIAQIKGQEPELGYLGSPPVKFPKAVVPPGHKTLDIRMAYGKIPEIHKIIIYECLDELKNDGSYRFSGAEITWRDKMTGQIHRIEKMCGEKDGCRERDIGSLDYIKKIVLNKKEHEGVEYISFCGIIPHLAEPAGAGELKLPVKEVESTNTEFTEGLMGLRLVFHKKLKVITDVIPVYARVADKKTKVDAIRDIGHSFFKNEKEVQALYGTKIYDYKAPENKYEDFATFITNGKMRDEYIGGLPKRFLSPFELQKFNSLASRLGLQPLIDLLYKKGSIHHLKLDPAMENKVVDFVVTVLKDELMPSSESFSSTIRFCMKMLCIVYNDDENIWKKVKAKIGDDYKNLGEQFFRTAIQKCENDSSLAEVQKIENSHDEQVKQRYQKACPQCPDVGDEDDVEKIAKKYMLDAAQYLQEFHATFRSMFTKKEGHYHGAPTVKGLDRVKAKALEYQEKEKLSASDAIARTMDYLRGTVECKNLKQVLDAYNKLKNLKGDYKIVRVKNGFKDLTEKGYKSILLNIMIYNCQIAEVQITIEAFKEGNAINHFIYEVIREHSLYDMVAKNLNLATAFKEWLEPIAPASMHETWPHNQEINLKGFMTEGATGFWDALVIDPKKRHPCSMEVKANDDYKLDGYFNYDGTYGRLFQSNSRVKFPSKLTDLGKNLMEKSGINKFMKNNKGISEALGVDKAVKEAKEKLDIEEESTIEWKIMGARTMIGASMGLFKGKFLDEQMIEGEYIFKYCDDMGNEKMDLPTGYKNPVSKGTFRLWVDDNQLPGLNATLLAFREVLKTSRIVRKKNLPKKVLEWQGFLGGSGRKADDEPLNLKIKIGNPNNFPYLMSVTGKGKLGKTKITEAFGYHSYYDSVTFHIQTQLGDGCFNATPPRKIECTGRFIEDLKIIGIYEHNAHFGRFTIDCVDPEMVKKWGPKGENDNNRYDLIIIYNDGQKQYNQLVVKANPDHTVVGTGFNFDTEFKIEGREEKKGIHFTRTMKKSDGTTETLTFDGAFLTGGLYEGLFRSENDWGKFKLSAV